MSELITILLWTFTALMLAQTAVYVAATRWHQKRAHVVTHGEGGTLLERLDDGLAKEAAMYANPPWYIRYTNWIGKRSR